MAINKNFVVKNGIEVNTNLIVADTDSSKVGIGTTVPEYTLHVFEGAGIGVTNITVTGISTNLDELNVGVGGTTLTAISNATLGIGGSVGVGTDAPGYLLEVHSPVSSGQTALFVRGDMRVTGDINIDDISIGDLNVSGISTFEGNILIGTGATVGFGSTAYFKDHAKAIFGDGEDLKVYHDGSNSYISDTGTGGLIVGSNSLTVKNAALNETQAVFTENGAVELYHDNGKRFETNAIGVEVSGTFESTGITTLASSGGITTTGGDLYVGGDLYINEDIVLDTNLEILGIATIGSIHVTGISTFDGELRGPNLTNSIVVGTGLSVRGSATGVAVTLAGAGGITTTGGDFYVGGDLYISEDVVLDTNLNILGIATIGSLNISGASGINTIDSTVQSSSKDTGALVIEGGVGIEKNLFVGGGVEITGITTITGNLEADGVVSIDDATQSSSTTTGALKVDGGAGIVKNLYVGGGAEVTGLTTITGVLDANNTTQSTSATTGAAKFAGGVGIEKQLYVGAGASVGAGLTVAGNLLPEADGTRDLGASGTEWKDLYIDGTANIDSLSADTAIIGDLADNRVVIAGSGGELEDSADLTFDGDTLAVNAIFDSNDTTQSTSATTGSAQFAGGVGIEKQLYVGAGASVGAGFTIGTGIGVTTILDDDTFTNASAGALASQQSIKAYVDAQVSGSDLDFAGDSGGTLSVDLDSQTFTIAGTSNEIETSGSGQTLTIGLPDNVTIGGELDVTTLDVSGNADIDGHTELDNVNVAGFSTFVSNVIIGTGATVGFGSTAFFKDNAKAIFGDDEDLQIYHTGGHGFIRNTTGQLSIRDDSEVNITDLSAGYIFKGTAGGSVELYHNTSKKFETTTDGTITTGIATVVSTTAADSSNAYNFVVRGNDNGTDDESAQIFLGAINATTRGTAIAAQRKSSSNNHDLIFKTSGVGAVPTERLRVTSAGSVGIGSAIPAQALDILNANPVIRLTDTDPAGVFSQIDGAGGDLILTADGGAGSSNSFISFRVDGNDANAEKLRVSSDGNLLQSANGGETIFEMQRTDSNTSGAVGTINFLASDDHSVASLGAVGDGDNEGAHIVFRTTSAAANNSPFNAATPERLRITSDGDVEFKGNLGVTSMSFDRSSNSLDFVDNAKAQFGDGDDLQIWHQGTYSIIQETGPGQMFFQSNGTGFEFRKTDGEDIAKLNVDGSVELYYDNSKKFETTSSGALVTGIATVSGTSHLTIPVGTTAQRDSIVANGMIRYNTTLNSYEGYGNGAWGGLGGGTEIDLTLSTTSATNLTTFAHASYRSASMRIQITQGSSYQVGKYLLIHDGTTVTIVEESAIATGDMLGSISGAINGDYVQVKVSMNSASSATVTTIIDKITV